MRTFFGALGFCFAGLQLTMFVLSIKPGKEIDWGSLLVALANMAAGIYLLA